MIITVIGSRKASQDILDGTVKVNKWLLNRGHTLRSGNAGGMDNTVNRAYELTDMADNSQIELYIPWPGFNAELLPHSVEAMISGSDPVAREIAESMHPAWERCSQGARKLHTRNVHQVLGADCATPSDIVLYWAPETTQGVVSGGTATAVKLARSRDIHTINILFDGWNTTLKQLVGE